MREAVAVAQQVAADAEARCIARESTIRELHMALDEARNREASARASAERAAETARTVEMALEASRDETLQTRSRRATARHVRAPVNKLL